MTVVGIDPSLTATGLAVIKPPHLAGTPNVPELATVGTAPMGSTLAHRALRVHATASRIWTALPSRIELVVIEELPSAMPNNIGALAERQALWWTVVRLLAQRRIPVVAIHPGTLKKFATGSGRAEKDDMLTAMQAQWPHAQLGRNHNRADALALATAGAIDCLGWYPHEAVHQHLDPKVWAEVGRRKVTSNA